MDDESEEEAMMVREKVKEKVKEANRFADTQLSSIHNHIQYTLQKAYFKCAYECFDGPINKDDVDECVDYCSVPVLKAHYLVEEEIAQFQDRLEKSMKVCQDKFEVAKSLPKSKITARNELNLCLDQSVKESNETLPYIVERLKRFLSID